MQSRINTTPIRQEKESDTQVIRYRVNRAKFNQTLSNSAKSVTSGNHSVRKFSLTSTHSHYLHKGALPAIKKLLTTFFAIVGSRIKEALWPHYSCQTRLSSTGGGGAGGALFKQFAPLRDFCSPKFGPKTIEN